MEFAQQRMQEIYKNIERAQQIDVSSLDDTPSDLKQIAIQSFNSKEQPIQARVLNEIFDCGPLKVLFDDEEITEILVNGEKQIYFEKNGCFLKHDDSFMSPMSFNNFIHKLCKETEKQYDYNTPHLDALWNGFRLHLIAPPLVKTPHLSFRRHPRESWTLNKLYDLGWADSEGIRLLKEQVQQKKNMIIIGPTGTGKTSVLNALLREIGELERAIIIEDSRELCLPNKMSVQLETRHSQSSELKTYELCDLIKQSLRMRPERLVLGEVRGPEAKDLLMLLSTGHRGGFCTLHADSARQALLRLEMLVQLGAPHWNIESIRKLIHLSLDSIVVLEQKNSKRCLESIHQISSLESHGLLLERVY